MKNVKTELQSLKPSFGPSHEASQPSDELCGLRLPLEDCDEHEPFSTIHNAVSNISVQFVLLRCFTCSSGGCLLRRRTNRSLGYVCQTGSECNPSSGIFLQGQ